ncbi:MAG: DegT/DnrJ/EryC1/StrS family aminotransferase [Bryobacteraceae bacterium]
METAIRKIPLLDVPAQTQPIRVELEEAIGRVLDHGRYILGPEVTEFEKAVAAYCGAQFAVACASGSDAVLLALMGLGVGPGHRVITTPYTFFATASAVTRLGATPVFIDIDPATYNIDVEALARSLATASAEEVRATRAILPVHLFGQCAEMDSLLETAARYGVPVVEDAAQAIGAEYRGRRAGSMGGCGCFSFFPSKNLGAMGDGGLLTFNDADFAAKVRLLRGHGAEKRYYHRMVGINSRLDTLQAAILLVKLRHLDEWTARRRRNAELYRRALAKATAITLPVELADCRHIYNQFVVRVPQRDRVREAMAQAGVASEIYYPVPLHLQECFAYLGYSAGDLPNSEAAAASSLALPIGHERSDDDIEYIAATLADCVAASPQSVKCCT